MPRVSTSRRESPLCWNEEAGRTFIDPSARSSSAAVSILASRKRGKFVGEPIHAGATGCGSLRQKYFKPRKDSAKAVKEDRNISKSGDACAKGKIPMV